MSPAKLTIEERMIRALLKCKRDYEEYFKTKKSKPDNAAQTAYTALIKTIVDISRKSLTDQPRERDPEEALKRAREILRTEYGIER